MNRKSLEVTRDSQNSGLLRKKDLISSKNLKEIFRNLNNHLYSKLKNTDTDTRTRSKEIVNLLFCKLLDEMSKNQDDILDFQIKLEENPHELSKRIQQFFQEKVLKNYDGIFRENESIHLTPDLIYMTVNQLQHISLMNSSHDIFKDAFEIFVSKILKDEGGQFFTPSNIVSFMVEYLNPSLYSKILDPACGHGGFLLAARDLLEKKLNDKNKKSTKQKSQYQNIVSNLYGVDKDLFLTKIAALYLEILGGEKPHIFCEDSLNPSEYHAHAKMIIKNDFFDYILTNPPFGSKIPVDEKDILKNYELGHIWKNYSNSGWKRTEKLTKQQPPQILFIERCIQLLKDGGKLGIVLPEGIFGNPSDRYIWKYLKSKGKILAIISLGQNAFQPYTCNKTSILFFQKISNPPKDYFIEFALVENVGHDKDGKIIYKLNKDGSPKKDSEGKTIINDDLDTLNKNLTKIKEFSYSEEQNVFKMKVADIHNNIFIPNYYLGIEKRLEKLASDDNYDLKTIQELINDGIIYTNRNGYIPRGDEIGSKVYGLGDIPFIRTSEISDWQVNLDSNKKTSEEVYKQYEVKQNIEIGDILLVKDGGPNLIGRTAFITKLDTKIIIQSHIYQIKTLGNEDAIDAYLLLFLLNLDIVQKQIKSVTFIQGTIATIGNRIMELKLPIPRKKTKRKEISNTIKEIIQQKVQLRKKITSLSLNSFFS
ncbi:MAG: putative type I restriction enzymeP M protein [Promethearchaeota archaeon]|nr:MAG: putative type I restriction enzymeP M protein [Candidatus Lokiarchaeota archaeon]